VHAGQAEHERAGRDPKECSYDRGRRNAAERYDARLALEHAVQRVPRPAHCAVGDLERRAAGADAAPALEQTLALEEAKRAPNGGAADAELRAQSLFRGERAGVTRLPRLEPGAQDLRDLGIPWRGGRSGLHGVVCMNSDTMPQ